MSRLAVPNRGASDAKTQGAAHEGFEAVGTKTQLKSRPRVRGGLSAIRGRSVSRAREEIAQGNRYCQSDRFRDGTNVCDVQRNRWGKGVTTQRTRKAHSLLWSWWSKPLTCPLEIFAKNHRQRSCVWPKRRSWGFIFRKNSTQANPSKTKTLDVDDVHPSFSSAHSSVASARGKSSASATSAFKSLFTAHRTA
eukprot:scaffold416_cov329-Pavlova_lutheri.AAC.16